MAIHDWSCLAVDLFYDLHIAWITKLRDALNDGLLPQDYYALAEQHAGRIVAAVLTLHASRPNGEPPPLPPASAGGLALADAPPKVRRQLTGTETYRQRRRSLAIRHISGHRLIALIEVASPANKDRLESVEELLNKAVEALDLDVHVLLIDLFPPGRHDPRGLHGAI